MPQPLNIFIVAGEASGDRLGAALMQGMKTTYIGEITFHGVGGPLMEARGLNSLFPMHELSIFGLLEIIPKYRGLKRRLNQTVEHVIAQQPDLLITIDSPGFCLRLAKAVRGKIKAPAIHYVAPSVWAWKPGRAQKMATHVDHVLALLPFEPPYMQAAGMTCDFVGHPVVAEVLPSKSDIAEFRTKLGISENQRLITILPGSRMSEITRLAPVFFETAKQVQHQVSDVAFVIPVAAGHLLEPLSEILRQSGLSAHLLNPTDLTPDDAGFRKRICFAASELALAASGTVSIELAATGTPMVIGYKTNWLTAWIMRRAMLAPSFTLVNLLTDSKAVPEFEPRDCTVENLTREMLKLLNDPNARAAQIEVGHQAIVALGKGGEDPGLRAAKSVLSKL